VHLPVTDEDLRFRHDVAQLSREQLDVVHAVVHEVHLPAAPISRRSPRTRWSSNPSRRLDGSRPGGV
jgi:hypothetical protein